ncbi:MAG: DUF1302 family protein [Parvibaculales bacterium]
MYKSKLRLLSVSALVGAGLLATGPADAYNLRLGSVDVQIDTTMSIGATIQMKDSNAKFLPEGNGGPAENNPTFDWVRDADGDIKYYDPTILHTDNTPAYLNSDNDIRETALVTVAADANPLDLTNQPGTSNLATGARQGDVASGALIPKGGRPVLDYNGATGVVNCDIEYGGHCQNAPAALAYNYDGSVNTDDGRLNFEKNDVVSAPVKLVTDISANQGAFSSLFRVKVFYDAILMDDGNFLRGGELTDEGEELAGQSIDLLDAFVAYDFDIGDMPVTVRAGKQVINWGEATFIPGGNSAFNPIDVPAIRRPGAEIKEALLPVEALYGSIALTDTVSLEAYVGGWDRYKLDVGGTFFAGSDSAEPGHSGGSPEKFFFVGGGPKSGYQYVCDTDAYAADADAASQALFAAVDAAWSKDPCAGSTNTDSLANWTEGSVETERHASMPGYGIGRLEDDEGDASMGLAVRWYAENLNSTEFGFYYQKADSRLPYVSYVVNPTKLAPSIIGPTASQVTRGAGISGCFANIAADFSKHFNYQVDEDDDTDPADVVFDYASAHYRPASGDITISDPDELTTALGNATALVLPGVGSFSGTGEVLQGSSMALGALFARAAAITHIEKLRKEADPNAKPFVIGHGEKLQYDDNGGAGTAANIARFGEGVVVYEDNEAAIAAYDAANSTNFATNVAATRGAANAQADTVYGDAEQGTIAAVQQANCAAMIMQGFGNLAQTAGHPFDKYGQLKTGAVGVGYTQDLDLYLEHPEVETYGFSFNTVLAGWGVQGDFTFRPDAPLQIDTDVLTIAGLFQQCAAIGASGVEYAYMGLENYNHEFLGSETGGCTPTKQTLKGYVEHDVITWDIGTTATFTRSNPIISAIGADIGILLTEFQGLMVDGAEDRATPTTNLMKVPLSNACTSGSDLALNSVLSIDQRPIDGTCRPTDNSMGMVLLGRATWNNVLGTPIALSPTVVYRTGLSGISPSPLGSWKEDVGSTALSLGFDYLGSLSGSLSYVTYQGEDLFTKNGDREHMSVSVSYAF